MDELYGRPVGVADMLRSRDERAARQRALLSSGGALICLTMNVAGPVKATPLIRRGFLEGVRLVRGQLRAMGARVRSEEILERHTGFEGYLLTDADARAAKLRSIGSGNQQSGSSIDVCLRSMLTCEIRRSWSFPVSIR